jgi:tetratricopeptide (TPR) repeat protein
VIGLRNQGRYREALALAREERAHVAPDRYQLALLDMETGRGRVAADEFLGIIGAGGDSASGRRSAPADTSSATDGLRARYRAWLLTLAATSAVAGGDTSRARGLVDTIESVGRRSLFGRDPLLHHFVRGLLFSRAGQHEAAVREYRAAIHSPTYGYTRINYELGKSLLALGRAAEGIPVVRSALHGGIEGSGLYITRTELHELAAQLFDAAHQRDSAAAHFAVVERAWKLADPPFKTRYDFARAHAAPR